MRPTGWTAIVFASGSVYLASERESVRAPVTAGAVERPRHILDRAARLIHGNAAGVVLIDRTVRPEVWARQTVATGGGRVALVDDEGWTATAVEPWTTWHSAGAPAIHVGFLSAIEQDRVMVDAGEPGETARRLAWYQDRIGAPLFMTPGVAGHAAIRAAFRKPGKGQQPYWGARDWRESDDRRDGIGDLIWRRAPMRSEIEAGGWVHGFDLNAARLAALGVAEMGWGRLRHTGAVAFDPTLAGYWQIHARDVRQHPRHPPILDGTAVHEGMAWPTTPIMKHLMDRGINPPIADSWTTEGRRIFRTLAERWDAARLLTIAEGGPRHEAVKATYRETAGLFARRGGSIYRPDWYHTAMDRQRVTVLGHCDRIAREYERRPVAIHTDCLWFVCNEEDPTSAAAHLGIKIGRGLGTFRVHSSTPVRDYFQRRTP